MRINPALASDPARGAIPHGRPKHDFASIFSGQARPEAVAGQPHPANGGLLGQGQSSARGKALAQDAASERGGAGSGGWDEASVPAVAGAAGTAPGASTLQQLSRERAFGLDELGVFGLRLDVALGSATPAGVAHAAVQPDTPASAAAVQPLTSAVTAVSRGAALSGAAGGAPADTAGLVQSPGSVTPAMQPAATALAYAAVSAPAIGMGAAQEADGDAVTAVRAAPRAMAAGPVSLVARLSSAPARLAAGSSDLSKPDAPGSARGEEPDLPGGDAKTQLSTEAARAGERDGKSGPSLLVTSIGGALQVVAAAGDVDPAAAARLRRMAEETAAAFGKRVQSISVNGQTIEPAPIGFKGGA